MSYNLKNLFTPQCPHKLRTWTRESTGPHPTQFKLRPVDVTCKRSGQHDEHRSRTRTWGGKNL